jgi:hypothetical protein
VYIAERLRLGRVVFLLEGAWPGLFLKGRRVDCLALIEPLCWGVKADWMHPSLGGFRAAMGGSGKGFVASTVGAFTLVSSG